MKRGFDLVLALAGILLFWPLLVLVAIAVKLDSRGPVFFRQERVGRNFKTFGILKFRTMHAGQDEEEGPLITASGDKRVTGTGRFLRKYKLDELPQLINVLKGEMSLVGPRPEVGKYVEIFRPDYERLLKVRPGITDPASLGFSNEEDLLSAGGDREEDYYVRKILPEKIRLSSEYIEQMGFLADLKIILRTVLKSWLSNPARRGGTEQGGTKAS